MALVSEMLSLKLVSPSESWAGGPLNPLVRLRIWLDRYKEEAILPLRRAIDDQNHIMMSSLAFNT